MSFVDDVKHAWRWFSVQCMALATIVQGTWLSMPDDMRASLPPHTASITTTVLLFLGIGGRLIKQDKPKPKKKKKNG